MNFPLLEKVAKDVVGKVTSSDTPYNIGLSAGQNKDDRSREAQYHGVEQSMARGALLGGAGGAALGGSTIMRTLTSKGREKAIEGLVKDYHTVNNSLQPHRHLREVADKVMELKNSGATIKDGINHLKGHNIGADQLKHFNRGALQDIVKRRGVSALKSGTIAAGGFGLSRMLINRTQYEAGKKYGGKKNDN